jgi:hypothetical protein
MPKPRPALVTVVAVLHFVFGGLGLLCQTTSDILNVSGVAQKFNTMFTPPSNAQMDPQMKKRMEMQEKMQQAIENVPGAQAKQWADLVQDTVLSVCLIVAGIGLLQMGPWARMLSMVYAVVSILYKIGSIVYMALYFLPAMQALAKEFAGDDPISHFTGFIMQVSSYGAIAMLLGAMIYPIFVLIAMLVPSVAAAFRGEPLAKPVPPEAIEEEERWGR